MGIRNVGTEWWIELPERRIRFEHDGSGSVRMQTGTGGAWVTVQPTWAEERVLCWDNLCARGALPLA